jgi:hypothetical protein
MHTKFWFVELNAEFRFANGSGSVYKRVTAHCAENIASGVIVEVERDALVILKD